jgi:hypothetical protein
MPARARHVCAVEQAGDEDAVGAGGGERLAAIDGHGEGRDSAGRSRPGIIGARVDDDADAGFRAARAMAVIFSHWANDEIGRA